MNADELTADLILDEGIRLKPYTDTAGKLTIGVGRNLTDDGISADEARALLGNDIADAWADLQREYPWVVSRPESVQRGLCNMAVNMGVGGLAMFKQMLACCQAGDYNGMADAALNSTWATQVGSRAFRIAALFRNPTDSGSVGV